MSDPLPDLSEAAAEVGLDEINGPDETAEVLLALAQLCRRVSSPVVRACLEEAHEDIAHLAGADSPALEAAEAA